MIVKLKKAAPKRKLRRLLEEKMLAKIGVGSRVAEEAKAKADMLRAAVLAEREQRRLQEAESAQPPVKSQPDPHVDLLPMAGAKASPTLEGSISAVAAGEEAGRESVVTDVAAVAPAAAQPEPAGAATSPAATEHSGQHPSPLELVLLTPPGSAGDDSSLNERLSVVSHLECLLLVVAHLHLTSQTRN